MDRATQIKKYSRWLAVARRADAAAGSRDKARSRSANAIINGTVNPTGPDAVQVVFSDNSANALSATNTGGVPASFNAPTSAGTPASAGQHAQILYNADGSFLANGTTDVNWPGWITSVEVGVTGTNGHTASRQRHELSVQLRTARALPPSVKARPLNVISETATSPAARPTTLFA